MTQACGIAAEAGNPRECSGSGARRMSLRARALTRTTSRRLWELVHHPSATLLAALDSGRANPPMPRDRRGPSRKPLRSLAGRVKRSGCDRGTGIRHGNKQQDGADGQEKLARRPEHEAAEPDQRDDRA